VEDDAGGLEQGRQLRPVGGRHGQGGGDRSGDGGLGE
jgi:hypothetical protein